MRKTWDMPQVEELNIRATAKNENISGNVGAGTGGTGRCPVCNMPLVSGNHKKGCTYGLS